MKHSKIRFHEGEIPLYIVETMVIGSGCAGLNAADTLYDLGKRDMVLVTEGLNMGTSRNAGSDKQTYYKLALCSDQSDSVQSMAATLFSGGGVQGDIALAESAGSLLGFFKLVHLGVPFPTNEYGEYVGYKTDHDPIQRATSAGPLTSKMMTEALEHSVIKKEIPIHDNIEILRLIVCGGQIAGAVALDKSRLDSSLPYVLYRCQNAVVATGGPAAVYHTSVYPKSQTGMTGMLLEAGAAGTNLQQWQYGLASTKFRWNLSGTYQQVLPRFISIDQNGKETETFSDYFDDLFHAADMGFLKGYQWPFDVNRISDSSIVDIIVHNEVYNRGRTVYMDFTRNPSCIDRYGFERLSQDTREYLKKSHALFGTPIQRLHAMNSSAVKLYQDNGIDIKTEPLEISVCAQHCNGGIAVDSNWESCIKGLFVAGEAVGTFGPYRPGGSALNSAQVGSRRAAECIAYRKDASPLSANAFLDSALPELEYVYALAQNAWNGVVTLSAVMTHMQKRMSACAAHIRTVGEMTALAAEVSETLRNDNIKLQSSEELPLYFKFRDLLSTQRAVLSASITAAETVGSQGSVMIRDHLGESVNGLPDAYRYRRYCPLSQNAELLTRMENGSLISQWQAVRPIPNRDIWFENVWRDYKKRTGN